MPRRHPCPPPRHPPPGRCPPSSPTATPPHASPNRNRGQPQSATACRLPTVGHRALPRSLFLGAASERTQGGAPCHRVQRPRQRAQSPVLGRECRPQSAGTPRPPPRLVSLPLPQLPTRSSLEHARSVAPPRCRRKEPPRVAAASCTTLCRARPPARPGNRLPRQPEGPERLAARPPQPPKPHRRGRARPAAEPRLGVDPCDGACGRQTRAWLKPESAAPAGG
mmetsp:Transcript_8404/g.33183  ORF Transcript_8404/g.33183 Transcript_8404/m.33183 type:complete len:223 (-) Transcript_8404:45-713(-)